MTKYPIKVVVVEGEEFEPSQLERLNKLAKVESFFDRSRTEAETIRRIGDAEVAVILTARMTANVMDSCSNLKMVACRSAGYDWVDVAAAQERGIVVSTAPGYSKIAVAEHTFALILALTSHIVQANEAVHSGQYDWRKFRRMQLWGKTLGIVGFGHIGREVARLGKGLGLRVIVYDPYVEAELEPQLNVEMVSLQRLLAESEIITIHAPLTEATVGMIGDNEFAQMMKRPIFINTARGAIVDEGALLRALPAGQIRGAGLDVFTQEPPDLCNPLFNEENVICTPHIGANTAEAQYRMSEMVIDNIEAFLEGHPQHVVS